MDYAVALWGAVIQNAPNLVGFVLPPIVEVINKDAHTDEERYILAFLVCLGAAGLLHGNDLIVGKPDLFVSSLSVIFLESNALYKLYFAKSALRSNIRTYIQDPPESEVVQAPSQP